jgi:hypothetical protein
MSDDPAPKASIPDSDAAKLGARLLRFLPFITIAHFLVALPTLIISLALAYFAFVQADATRKMQTGGAMPFVTFGTSNFNDKTNVQEISLSLSNNGIGPAILGPIEVRYEGRPMANAEQLLGTCCGGGRTSFSTSPASGIALRPGESASFLRLTRSPQNEKIWSTFNDERWKLQVRSCYCSIFDDCWVVDGMQTPKPVKTCPANWTLYGEMTTIRPTN